ncbi:hypothetical protein OG564_13490 [Streptomyces sp. NBC_01280]|nr:hypothetical protein [Streptomyces sp. NBC_01280]
MPDSSKVWQYVPAEPAFAAVEPHRENRNMPVPVRQRCWPT